MHARRREGKVEGEEQDSEDHQWRNSLGKKGKPGKVLARSRREEARDPVSKCIDQFFHVSRQSSSNESLGHSPWMESQHWPAHPGRVGCNKSELVLSLPAVCSLQTVTVSNPAPIAQAVFKTMGNA